MCKQKLLGHCDKRNLTSTVSIKVKSSGKSILSYYWQIDLMRSLYDIHAFS